MLGVIKYLNLPTWVVICYVKRHINKKLFLKTFSSIIHDIFLQKYTDRINFRFYSSKTVKYSLIINFVNTYYDYVFKVLGKNILLTSFLSDTFNK